MSVHYVPTTVLDTKHNDSKAGEPMSSRTLIQRLLSTCILNINKVLFLFFLSWEIYDEVV